MDKYYSNPRTEELRSWRKHVDREPLDEGLWMADQTEYALGCEYCERAMPCRHCIGDEDE